MLFLYDDRAGDASLTIEGDAHRYLFKVRRHQAGDRIAIRHMRDDRRFLYEIVRIDKKQALLHLIESENVPDNVRRSLHIGWCVIDPKQIEKTLPSLNEIGVAQVTFIYCKRSQHHFKLDFRRFEKILRNSSQQCGRARMMRLDVVTSLESFVQAYSDAFLLDFSSRTFDTIIKNGEPLTLVVGCEGGISEEERALFRSERIVGFETSLVLRSETAVCAAAAQLLL